MLLALAILVLTPQGWQSPEQATTAEVLRIADGVTTTPFVPVSEIGPGERIKVCKDDPNVLPGSTTKCSTLEDGKDNWLAKSAVFAEAPAMGSIGVIVRCDETCAAQPDAFVRLYGAKEGQEKKLLDAAPVAPRLTFRVEGPPGEFWCFEVTTIQGERESRALWESQAGVPACETFAGNLAAMIPPTDLDLVAPAPQE